MAKKEKPIEPIVAIDPVAYRVLKEQETALSKEEKTSETNDNSLLGTILKSLKDHESKSAIRMAFEVDPQANYVGGYGMYRLKSGLTPDHIIKRITGPQGDELVNQILQARANIIASFGRPRTSRFAIGFEFQENSDSVLPDDEQKKELLQKQINNVKEYLWNCGVGPLDDEVQNPNLSQFLKMIVRDGLSYGRFAVELLHQRMRDGTKKLYAFRPVDAGTIYKIYPKKEQDQSLRTEAIKQLERLKNKKIDVEKFKRDEYKWVQVIEGRPIQAFTEDELIVYNLYPVTNVEYNGYPLTPIDQALNAITTHINITIHNKLYFQNGRAARGMLVFKSDTIDEPTLQKIRLQFHQSINSVQNSWRMPVFGVGSEDNVTWQSIDVSGRDAEFQYLMDNNARVILSAFQMSPEELPGYAHLARGTNTQALSESDNEWKLTAARDVGLRPLLYDIQDFLNTHILSRVDESLSKTHQIVLAGLDKDSPEKEATRITQDMSIHMSYNDVLEAVEKDTVAKELGGEFPLNQQFQTVVSQYLTVGEILENFFGKKGAAQDPRYQYIRDPFWFQYQQIMLQKAQLTLQQQMAMQQQQMAMQQQQQGDGDSHQDDGNEPPPSPTGNKEEDAQKTEEWIKNNYTFLAKKTDSNHNKTTRILLNRHHQLVDEHLKMWKNDTKKALSDIQKAIEGNKEEE